MADGLKIRIGADLQGAIQQVNTLTSSITGLGKAVLQPINTNGLASAVAQLKVNIGNISTAKINQVPGALNNISVSANAASGRLQAMTQSLVNIGGNVGLIPANIQPIVNALSSISSQANITSSAVKALGSVMQLSIVSAGIVAAAATVGYLAYSYFQASQAEKEAADQAKKYAEEQDKLSLHLQDQVLNVQSLVRIAQSDISTKKEQAQALIALNDLIPDNIGKLTKQNITTEAGISIIRSYTRALEDQATAELLRGRAAELRVKKFDEEKAASDKILKITNDRAELLARMNRGTAQATPEEKQSNAFRVGSDIMTRQFDEFDRNIKSITDDLNISRHKLDEQLTALRDGIDQNTKGALPVTIKTPKTEKDFLKDAIKNLEDYQKEIGLTSAEFQKLINLRVQLVQRDQVKLGLDDGQLAKEIISIRNSNELLDARRKKLDDLSKTVELLASEKTEGLNIDVKIALNDLATGKLDLNQAQRTIDAAAKAADLRIPASLSIAQDVQAELKAKGLELPILTIPLKVNTEDLGVKDAVSKINTELALAGVKPIKLNVDSAPADAALEALNKSINTTVKHLATEAFSTIGEAIGTALAGGDVQKVFGDFILILSEGLKEIGKAMISFGIARLVLEKIAKINPVIAILAGVALVAAGAALKTSVNKRKLAEGGIVTGPTSATIGEAGPEVVFPLTDLNSTMRKIMGGQSGNSVYIPNVTIKGSDLVLAFNREKTRSGGSFSF